MEQLFGKLVVVDPRLENDVSSRQGHIGIILASQQGTDRITVGFDKGATADYSSNSLLVLKDKNELYQHILTGARDVDRETFKQLMQINMHQDYANDAHTKLALTMAAINPEVTGRSMVTLNEHMTRNQSVETGFVAYVER